MSTKSTPDPSPASESHKSSTADPTGLVTSAKRKRPQSCDSCRARKIKCVLLQVDGLQPGSDQRCIQCRAIDAKCTFDYVLKRPGPHPSFDKVARKKAEPQSKAHTRSDAGAQKAAAQKGSTSTSQNQSGAGASTSTFFSMSPSEHHPFNHIDDSWYRALSQHSFTSTGNASGTNTRASSWNGGSFDSYLNQSMLSMTPHIPSIPTNASFEESPHVLGIHPHSAVGSTVASSTPSSLAAPSPWTMSTSARSGSFSRPPPPQYEFQQLTQHPSATSSHMPEAYGVMPVDPQDHDPASQIPLPSFSRAVSPTPSYTSSHSAGTPMHKDITAQRSSARSKGKGKRSSLLARTVNTRPRSLDDIAPRQTFLSVISLYFHYLWPLLPIVHRPSFSKDLLNRRDERDEVFLTFVLSLTSYTLIQCPRTVLPASWSVFRKLHGVCHLASQRLQSKTYDPPLLLHVNTLYCDHIYLGTIGKTNAANAVLGEAIRVALMLGLHDETKVDSFAASQPRHLGAPLVERELRKRMFWVLHGSSTTIAVLHNQPVFIHEVDICLDMPLAVDEEALTTPVRDQSAPSILCGFLAVTQLHQIMLEVLESYRRDRRYPTEDLRVVQSRLRYLADASKRIQNVLDHMPLALRRPTFQHAPPTPVRKPGTAMPSLEAVAQPPSAQSPAEGALDHHRFSHTSAWPWPADTFSKQDMANRGDRPFSGVSPRAKGELRSSEAPMSAMGSIPHSVMTPTAFTAMPSGELSSLDQVNLFRPSPPPASTLIISPMCTMHANIIVTESLIRFLMAEYHALVTYRIRELLARHPATAPAALDAQDAGAGWQEAAANVLRAFNSMPLDALASNGQSLIDKIMYIVSSLLKRTSGSAPSMGYHYMSSLLLTLTKLSQTRMDDNQDDAAEDENSGDDHGGNDGDSDHDGDSDPDGNGSDDANGQREDESEQHDRFNNNNTKTTHDTDPRDTHPHPPSGHGDHGSTFHDAARSVQTQSDYEDAASMYSSSCPSSVPSTAPTSVVSTPAASYCTTPSAPLTLTAATLLPQKPSIQSQINLTPFKIPRPIENNS